MAKNETRRSQSVVPFGVGSIVEFADEALMPAGLEAWPPESEHHELLDVRLANRLGVKSFRTPPPKPDNNNPQEFAAPLPYVRFPKWHFCPRCRRLKESKLYQPNRPKCDNEHKTNILKGRPVCRELPTNKRPRMIPIAFVLACEHGHIEDFPWIEWAHKEIGKPVVRGQYCKEHAVFFKRTSRGGLAGALVICAACGVKGRTLAGVTMRGGLKGLACSGHRPWLGDDGSEACTATGDNGQLLCVQRGASNVYFPTLRSSILIPPFSSKLQQIIGKKTCQRIIDGVRENGRVPDSAFKAIGDMYGEDPHQLRKTYEANQRIGAKGKGSEQEETEYRKAEYKALHENRSDDEDSLMCLRQPIGDYLSWVKDYFSHVTLVERLAETRVLTGFHRISSTNPPSMLSRTKQDWLPAFRVHGEGIFITLNSERVNKVAKEAGPRLESVVKRSLELERTDLQVRPALIFLHTLAHLLIKRLSFDAGYGSSSLRERIYSSVGTDEDSMAGVLLYTAAGDADGTLGGLVALGKPGSLEKILLGAIDDARWCASDPICKESPGQGPDALNLAACHACALLPETSCELQNRLLDRQIVLDYFVDLFDSK